METYTKEIGLELGFASNNEAMTRPMTAEDHQRWFHQRQAVAMLAFALDGTFGQVIQSEEEILLLREEAQHGDT
jgi:hypothetical protein